MAKQSFIVQTVRFDVNPRHMPGIVEIGAKSFRDCKSLEKIELPSCTRFIRHGAFDGCDHLMRIILNEELECIDDYAFENCSELTKESLTTDSINMNSLTLPESSSRSDMSIS